MLNKNELNDLETRVRIDDFTQSEVLNLINQIRTLQEVIDMNNICHNLHGKVDARAFADGCAAEQRKLYGYAPDADELENIKSKINMI